MGIKKPMGPSALFGEVNEKTLVVHIKFMQAKGFPLTVIDVGKIAHDFAEEYKLTYRFNKNTRA